MPTNHILQDHKTREKNKTNQFDKIKNLHVVKKYHKLGY